MQELTFNINAQSETPARTNVKARNFEIIVDEPKQLGGSDQAATPMEYLLAAHAGCLNATGHMVAQQMGIELKGLKIEIEGTINPAKTFGKSDAERAGYKEIRVIFKPDTDADKAKLEKWVEQVESRCPVSDNIFHETPHKAVIE